MSEALYLIDGSSALSRFRLAAHQGTEHRMVSLHDGRATLSFSAEDARALGRALLAVSVGGFEVAETETAIQLREAEIARRTAAQAAARGPAPSLDAL